MTTLKDLIEMEVENVNDALKHGPPSDFDGDYEDWVRHWLSKSLNAIAKETANSLRGEELDVTEDKDWDIYNKALQDIARREEEFFNRDDK